MAHIAFHAPANFSLSRIVTSAFASLGRLFVLIGTANSRVRQVEFLQSLSDAELAKRGLKRDDIAHFVFKDMFYV